ncbi:MAG: serine O-acetyltransferase [Burkholderiaceae bacterium]
MNHDCAETAEPSCSGWTPADSLVASIGRYQRYRDQAGLLARLLRRFARIEHAVWSVVTASDIRPQAKFGRGVRMPHPTGVVIHHDAVIGDGCILMQQVTIGQSSTPGAPVLGANVYVGAGAKVLGAITIGDGARIGANAVVLESLPANCTAVGVPARVVRIGEAEQGACSQ